jgi:hypothetical protein
MSKGGRACHAQPAAFEVHTGKFEVNERVSGRSGQSAGIE